MPSVERVFISRDLEEGLPFVKQLEAAGLEVLGQSLLEFTPILFTKIPSTDWIFFYSKQGIRHYFDRLDQPSFWAGVRMGMPRKIQEPLYATFGKGSARFLKTYRKLTADFVGTGEAVSNAKAIAELTKGQSILFIRGRNSLRAVQEIIENENVETKELIVYDNTLLTDFSFPQCHYLLFTSPLNATAYYQKYTVKSWQKVYAIGETTAEALLSLGVEKVVVAESPSMESLAKLVLESID